MIKKIAKWFLISLIGITLIGFFMPEKVMVEKSREMKADHESLYEQINDIKNWNNWMPWNKLDPNWIVKYDSITEGKGAGYQWESDNSEVGSGSAKIGISTFDSIIAKLDFGSRGIATCSFHFIKSEKGNTILKWKMDAEMELKPFARILGLFMKKTAQETFEEGLIALDSVALANAINRTKYKISEFEKVEIPKTLFIGKKITCSEEEIENQLGRIYGQIRASISKNKVEMKGHPFAIYYSYNPGKVIMEPAIEVSEAVKSVSNGLRQKNRMATKAVKASFFGAYELTGAAHESIRKYIIGNKLKLNGAPWEVYITDPTTVKDPLDVQTDIYYPIK